MKLQFKGKKFSLTITKSTNGLNDILHIEMEPVMADNVQMVKDEEGELSILRIEGSDQIEDFVKAISQAKEMMDA